MIEVRSAEERDTTAGEYVLGTLNALDHAAVAAALGQDALLGAAVFAWQDRLLALSARCAALTPSAQLWSRIDAAVQALPGAAGHPQPSIPSPNTNRRPALPWWQRLRLWQGLSGLALAASVFMAVLLGQQMAAPVPTGPRYLALLQSPQDRSTGWIVELQAGRKLRLVPVADMAPVPAGHSLQFWTKPQGAAAPTSLGLVRAAQSLELPLSALPGIGPQQLFEVTLEPEGGSPIARPTGPILYVGRTQAI